MKHLLILLGLFAPFCYSAQKFRPQALYLGYFGESVSHPGLKAAVGYELRSIEKLKTKKNGVQKRILKSIEFAPAIGFYYHRRYQSGYFLMPEIVVKRSNAKRNFIALSAGIGYLRTVIPNVYEQANDGNIKKVPFAGNNYVLNNLALTFGRNLQLQNDRALSLYLKPQFALALPNAANGARYFILEAGVRFSLTKEKGQNVESTH